MPLAPHEQMCLSSLRWVDVRWCAEYRLRLEYDHSFWALLSLPLSNCVGVASSFTMSKYASIKQFLVSLDHVELLRTYGDSIDRSVVSAKNQATLSTRIFSTTSAMLPSLPFGLPVLPRRIPHVSALWSLSCGTKWAMLGKLLHDGFVCNTIFKMSYDLL